MKQKNGIDEKLVYLLNKISQIIRYIHWEINKETKLSPLMLQILEYLYAHSEDLRTPHKIAEDLGVKKPTITDSLKVLINKGYIREEKRRDDRRYKILYLTEKGENLLKREEINVGKTLKKSIEFLSGKEKKFLFLTLIKFVSDLNQRGILPIVRICLNCANFERNKFKKFRQPHYCKLLNMRMSDTDLSVNCEKNISIIKK